MERERFDDLLARYEDGLASLEELNELAAGLNSNSNFRKELVARNRIEAGLHELSATRAAASRPSVREAAVRHARSRRSDFRKRTAHSSQWRIGIALAALLMLVLAGLRYFQSVEPATAAAPVAILEGVTGAVSILRGNGSHPAREGLSVTELEGLQTENGARASLRFADGTTITLFGASESRVWLNGPAAKTAAHGKQMTLDRGSLEASVAPQPVSMPLIIRTPHTEIKILGTKFTLESLPDNARLEVREGHVQMKRIADGKSVDVNSGFYAVASREMEFAVLPILPPAALPAVSRPLFNGKDLSGWTILRGAWKVEDGVVIGIGVENKFARIESTEKFLSGELVCKLRVTDSRVAEIQFGGYRNFFPIHWETPGWKEIKVRVQGNELKGTMDGQPLHLVQGDAGEERTLGLLTFYATARSTLEIKDAHWTDSKP